MGHPLQLQLRPLKSFWGVPAPLPVHRWQRAVGPGCCLLRVSRCLQECRWALKVVPLSQTPLIWLVLQPFILIMQRSAVTAQMLDLICFLDARPVGDDWAHVSALFQRGLDGEGSRLWCVQTCSGVQALSPADCATESPNRASQGSAVWVWLAFEANLPIILALGFPTWKRPPSGLPSFPCFGQALHLVALLVTAQADSRVCYAHLPDPHPCLLSPSGPALCSPPRASKLQTTVLGKLSFSRVPTELVKVPGEDLGASVRHRPGDRIHPSTCTGIMSSASSPSAATEKETQDSSRLCQHCWASTLPAHTR